MSKIGDFFRTVGRIFASPFNKVLGTGLTQAQYEQNEWNAYEAALNRDFQHEEALLQRNWSAAEAERARDWQEEMYEKYNSLSGKIAQAEQAGVNPMFAVTGDSVTPAPTSSPMPSGSAAAGSAAAGSLSATDSFVSLIGQLMGAQKIQSEIAVNESIAQKNVADANKAEKETSWMDRLNEDKLKMSSAQRDLIDEQLSYLNTQANYLSEITEPESRLKRAQALMAEWEEKNKELFKGIEIGSDLLTVLANVGVGIVNAKAGLSLANRPLVVGKDASVFHPSDIVH